MFSFSIVLFLRYFHWCQLTSSLEIHFTFGLLFLSLSFSKIFTHLSLVATLGITRESCIKYLLLYKVNCCCLKFLPIHRTKYRLGLRWHWGYITESRSIDWQYMQAGPVEPALHKQGWHPLCPWDLAALWDLGLSGTTHTPLVPGRDAVDPIGKLGSLPLKFQKALLLVATLTKLHTNLISSLVKTYDLGANRDRHKIHKNIPCTHASVPGKINNVGTDLRKMAGWQIAG